MTNEAPELFFAFSFIVHFSLNFPPIFELETSRKKLIIKTKKNTNFLVVSS